MSTEKYPKGIPYIIGNELAERFSFYGMKAILMVFMTNYLMMSDNDSTQWYHLFGLSVYFFPIIGAVIADAYLGKFKTIILLSLIYCLGHLALALLEGKTGLGLGLLLIAIGSGGIKPAVSAHVGDQFNTSNQSLIERIFSWFYMAINIGAIISTLVIPWLLSNYGPHVAFGLPGFLMLLATFVFYYGRTEYISIKPYGQSFFDELRSKEGVRAIGSSSVVFLFISVFWALFDQTGSSWVVQAKHYLMDKTIDLGFWKGELLPSQIQAANPFFVILLIPLFTFLIYPTVQKFISFKPLWRIFVGMLLASVSFFIIAETEGRIQLGETVNISAQAWAYFILTVAEVLVAITALEFAYTQAPNKMKSFIMGLFMLSLSLGNFITAGINYFINENLTFSHVSTGISTLFTLEEELATGSKISISKDLGLVDLEGKPIEGSFIAKVLTGDVYEIYATQTGEPVMSKINPQLTKGTIGSTKLQGKAYFNFFAYFMLATAFCFIPIAFLYKEKTYIQSKKDQE